MSHLDGQPYFDNFGESGYEQISSWSPKYYQDLLESDTLMKFAGKITDLEAESLEQWCQNMFIVTMGEEMLTRMEQFFHLEANSTRDIEDRRIRLLLAIRGSGKVSKEMIRSLAVTYTGQDCEVAFPASELIITLDTSGTNGLYISDFMDVLNKKLPAHIKWTVDQLWVHQLTMFAGAAVSSAVINCPIYDGGWNEEYSNDLTEYSGAGTSCAAIGTIHDGGWSEEYENDLQEVSGTAMTSAAIGTIHDGGWSMENETEAQERSGSASSGSVVNTIN